jgi:hypothetical protein
MPNRLVIVAPVRALGSRVRVVRSRGSLRVALAVEQSHDGPQ